MYLLLKRMLRNLTYIRSSNQHCELQLLTHQHDGSELAIPHASTEVSLKSSITIIYQGSPRRSVDQKKPFEYVCNCGGKYALKKNFKHANIKCKSAKRSSCIDNRNRLSKRPYISGSKPFQNNGTLTILYHFQRTQP